MVGIVTDQLPAKERALNIERVSRIGQEVAGVLPGFDAAAFTADVMSDLPRLELKARIARVAQGLHDHLPVTGAQALDVLLRSLPATPKAAGIGNDFGSHLYSPHSEFVARYCRTAETLEPALAALRRFTCYFSAEDAVRYFLNDFPDQALAAVTAWASDGDYRVRRLASESTRPTLPWSVRINLPAHTTIPVLDRLHADSSRFVTQSVANHLRDITATHPDLVIDALARWSTAGDAAEAELAFIAREALRTKLKQGWPPAYAALGYASDLPIEMSPIRIDRDHLCDGDTLTFTAEVTSPVTAPIHVMYVIASTTSRGKPREKVFFLTRTTLRGGQPLALVKRHPLRSTATVKITPGPHTLQIQVNGNRVSSIPFHVD